MPDPTTPATPATQPDYATQMALLQQRLLEAAEVETGDSREIALKKLADPEFVKNNPGYVKKWGAALGIPPDSTPMVVASSVASLGTSIPKAAFAQQQLRQAEQIATNPPAPAPIPERNAQLRQALAQRYGQQQQGFTPAEMASAQGRLDAGMNQALARASRFSGGQAASAQAASLGALANTQMAANDLAARDAMLRRQNQQQYGQALGMSLQEQARINQAQQAQVYNYDMPLWKQRVAERARLEDAGNRNRFGAMDAMARDSSRLAGMFGDDLTNKILKAQGAMGTGKVPEIDPAGNAGYASGGSNGNLAALNERLRSRNRSYFGSMDEYGTPAVAPSEIVQPMINGVVVSPEERSAWDSRQAQMSSRRASLNEKLMNTDPATLEYWDAYSSGNLPGMTDIGPMTQDEQDVYNLYNERRAKGDAVRKRNAEMINIYKTTGRYPYK